MVVLLAVPAAICAIVGTLLLALGYVPRANLWTISFDDTCQLRSYSCSEVACTGAYTSSYNLGTYSISTPDTPASELPCYLNRCNLMFKHYPWYWSNCTVLLSNYGPIFTDSDGDYLPYLITGSCLCGVTLSLIAIIIHSKYLKHKFNASNGSNDASWIRPPSPSTPPPLYDWIFGSGVGTTSTPDPATLSNVV